MNQDAVMSNFNSLVSEVNTQPVDVDAELLRIVGIATLRGWDVCCRELMGVVSGPVSISHENCENELRLETNDDRTEIVVIVQ